jgi:putative ABC transport system permease protein
LIESLLLALIGASVGALCAHFGLKGLVAAIPEGLIPRESVISLNRPVLLFCLAVAVVTSVVCGLLPALRTARADLVEPLKDSGKGSSGGFRGRRLNAALVVGEVALSLVLLAGAGLLMRSFVKLQTVDLGMNPEGVLHARVPLPRGQYDTAVAKRQFFSQVLMRVRALPGVVSASVISSLPPYGGIRLEIDVPGKTHDKRWEAIYNLCSEGYFETLGVRRLRGRLLSETDVQTARNVAVVSKTFVDRYFHDEDPIGRSVDLKGFATVPEALVTNTMYEIVGIVGDVRNQGIQDPPIPEMFIPYTVTGVFERGILVKTTGAPLALVNSLRHEVWEVDRRVAVTMTGSLPDYLTRFSYAEPRFTLVVLGVFATTGLALVALGVFSVIAYTVARHTHEIGIRIALGAGRGDVMRMVLWLGVRLAGGGIVIGLLSSMAVTRVLASQLFGVTPNDPVTLAGVATVVATASLIACYLPARRATAVDPMEALRHE